MTNKFDVLGSVSDALARIPSATMDSAFENSIVIFLKRLNVESVWKIVCELLTHPKANVRALGLRVVRRQFKDKDLLGRVIHLCFSVEKLTELQYWYAAILAHYPMMDFLRKLKAEAANRKDSDFIALHIRALQMHKADGSKVKKIAVEKLIAFSLSGVLHSRS